MKDYKNQMFSSGLRGTTLLARLLLTLFLAKYATPEEVGLFALYWAGITLASSIMGLDVYAFTSRSLLRSNTDRVMILSLHTGFLLLSGLLFIPVSTFLFYSGTQQASSFLIIIYFFHLPFEFYSQEISRLLIPLNRPLISNIILFVRSALWVPIVIVSLVYNGEIDPIEMIATLWLIASIASSVLSHFYLKIITKRIIIPHIKISWMKTALTSSGIFLLGTIIFRTILGGDRFLISNLLGESTLGVYAVYTSICLGVLGLLESGVSAWRYPKLVSAIQSGNLQDARKKMWAFWRENLIASSLLMSTIVFLFSRLAKIYLDNIYIQNLFAFYIIAFGVFLYSISMPFHYFIFGLKKDISFVIIYTVALVIMLVWGISFMSSYGVIGAGVMLSLALSIIALLRWTFVVIYLNRLRK